MFGAIILFIGIVIQPTIAITEPENTDESRVSDDHQEIITFIKGRGDLNWIERRGFFRGEVLLICSYQSGLINLSGYRLSESGIEYYNELIEKGFIYAYCFLGYSNGYWSGMLDPNIIGIAIGNIDWVDYA